MRDPTLSTVTQQATTNATKQARLLAGSSKDPVTKAHSAEVFEHRASRTDIPPSMPPVCHSQPHFLCTSRCSPKRRDGIAKCFGGASSHPDSCRCLSQLPRAERWTGHHPVLSGGAEPPDTDGHVFIPCLHPVVVCTLSLSAPCRCLHPVAVCTLSSSAPCR